MRFSEKVILITGASSGIGAETAVHFAREGASLCITGRDEKRLADIANKCRLTGNKNKILQIASDLSRTDGCEKILAIFSETFDTLDVLVNNAGVTKPSGFETSTMDEYDRMFDTNVKAMVHLSKLFITYLKQSRGCVVNVSSSLSTCPMLGQMFYGMTKAAMDYFTRSSALELASSGVRVNAVNPGGVRTPSLLQHFGGNQQVLDKMYDQIAKASSLGHLVPVSEVAESILYLSSDVASSITGTCLLIDAGFNTKTLKVH